jgi:hypothetical protein
MTARIANKAVPDPNDLSHLSDEEFWALCPQGEHAPGPEPVNVGEVEELVAWLRHYCDEEFGPQSDHPDALQIHRTADLLERQYPQPIPVNERLPKGLFPVEYFDMDSGARIVSEPSEEGPESNGCWVVLNSRAVNPCTEFSTIQAAWDALHPKPLPSGDLDP